MIVARTSSDFNKLKAFDKLLLLNQGIASHCHRIETQVRGMPHVHKVAWLDNEIAKKYMKDGSFDDSEDSKIDELIGWLTLIN